MPDSRSPAAANAGLRRATGERPDAGGWRATCTFFASPPWRSAPPADVGIRNTQVMP